MNGHRKSDVYAQEKQDFMGHPETEDAIAQLKEVLEYNAIGGKYPPGSTVLPRKQDADSLQQALTVGWCVELLQAFFLVADDIMDSSFTFRGQICRYQKPGMDLDAVNDAILLEACIYHLLKIYCREQPYYLNLTELFLQSSYQTGIRQTLDLIPAPQGNVDLGRFTEKRHKYIVKYKTAFYSFYLPVAAAMYMAGIDGKKEHTNAKKILLGMGEFFQVQDDYLDLFGDPSVTGEVDSDIQDQKCNPEGKFRQKEAEKMARVKALYEKLDLPAIFLQYEEDTYSHIIGFTKEYAATLPPASFRGLRTKSTSGKK
uniref:Farnesyl pyrophosphate synthase n=1 Tax=Colobus angolensis palliatus TaxID=336983 RepID=A0A2K5IYQ7_COLAP